MSELVQGGAYGPMTGDLVYPVPRSVRRRVEKGTAAAHGRGVVNRAKVEAAAHVAGYALVRMADLEDLASQSAGMNSMSDGSRQHVILNQFTAVAAQAIRDTGR